MFAAPILQPLGPSEVRPDTLSTSARAAQERRTFLGCQQGDISSPLGAFPSSPSGKSRDPCAHPKQDLSGLSLLSPRLLPGCPPLEAVNGPPSIRNPDPERRGSFSLSLSITGSPTFPCPSQPAPNQNSPTPTPGPR